MATGWSTGLCQDYNRGLGRWFADRLGAREQLRRLYMKEPVSEELAVALAKRFGIAQTALFGNPLPGEANDNKP